MDSLYRLIQFVTGGLLALVCAVGGIVAMSVSPWWVPLWLVLAAAVYLEMRREAEPVGEREGK